MKSLLVTAGFIFLCAATMASPDDILRVSSPNDNIQAIAGKWRPIESCYHLLDSDLVTSRRIGFEISIDENLGDSHRRSSGSTTHYTVFADALKNEGHEPLATGHIKFDGSFEVDHVIFKNNGSLYIWYGVNAYGRPRIFVGRGPDKMSFDTLVIEWSTEDAGTPIDLGGKREFATISYDRIE